MIVNMAVGATEAEIDHVVSRIKECGYQAHLSRGEERTVIGVVGRGDKHRSELEALLAAPGVEEIIHISHSFKLASRDFHPQGSIVELGNGITVGGTDLVIAAGPCAVESAGQIGEVANRVAQAGAKLLRGGAFKPRSSPYSFQGLGEQGLELLRKAADKNDLLVVSEVMDPSQVEMMAPYVDVMQVGARNMQNYPLLRRLATVPRPVLLKRGPSATIKEWLLAAEYLLSGGNPNVVLCERGIKTFDAELRNTLDLAGVALAKELCHLPVVVDPSHATGRRSLVPAAARAAVAIGADGIIVEVHPCPERALSDGPQSLDLPGFSAMMVGLQPAIAMAAAGR
jgi:3-deoxy-7-phosphoheptulonate synthase